MRMKIYFAYEKMSTKTRFENEAWSNSEMAYCKRVSLFVLNYEARFWTRKRNDKM